MWWIRKIKDIVTNSGGETVKNTIGGESGAPSVIRKKIKNSAGMVCMLTVVDGSLPAWPTFELGMAYFKLLEEKPKSLYLVLVDNEIINQAQDGSEFDKLYNRILTGHTIYIPFDRTSRGGEDVDKIFDDIRIKITNHIRAYKKMKILQHLETNVNNEFNQ